MERAFLLCSLKAGTLFFKIKIQRGSPSWSMFT